MLAAVCEGNWGNVAQKLVITSERETYLSPPSSLPIESTQMLLLKPAHRCKKTSLQLGHWYLAMQ